MGKLILIILFLCMTGCMSTSPIKTIEVSKPVMYVPEPPTVIKPAMLSLQLTADDKKHIGVVSKATAIDLVQITNYAVILETIINKYKELAKNNPKINIKEFMGETSYEEWLKINNAEKDINKIKDQ